MIRSPEEEKARAFAVAAHGEQRYGEHSYVWHLDMVFDVVKQYSQDAHLGQAAYLHDVVEDTRTTLVDVWQAFGPSVAFLVSAVTNEPGKNRKERGERTYPKIRKAGTEAVLLKLCDRIANAEAAFVSTSSYRAMYAKEHPEFIGALHVPGEWPGAWLRLGESLK